MPLLKSVKGTLEAVKLCLSYIGFYLIYIQSSQRASQRPYPVRSATASDTCDKFHWDNLFRCGEDDYDAIVKHLNLCVSYNKASKRNSSSVTKPYA